MKGLIFIGLVILLLLPGCILKPICGDGKCDYREVDICPTDCDETIEGNECPELYEWCQLKEKCILTNQERCE